MICKTATVFSNKYIFVQFGKIRARGRSVKKLGLNLKLGPKFQMQIILFKVGQDGEKYFCSDILGLSIVFSVIKFNINT